MDLAKQMQEKLYEMYVDNYYSDSKFGKSKAFLAAMAGGAIDGAVIVFPIMFTALLLTTKEIKRLRKK